MKCKTCGSNIHKNNNYCPYCGAIIKGSEKSIRVKKTWKTAIAIISMALIATFLIVTTVILVPKFRKNNVVNYLNTEKGTAFTEDELASIKFSDFSDEDWEIIFSSNELLQEIVADCSGVDGYIDASDIEIVINAVAEEVDLLYKDGIVSYYECGTDTIYFEYTCGLLVSYIPAQEDYLSGGSNYAVNILTLDLFSEELGTAAQISGQYIDNVLSQQVLQNFSDQEVTIEQLLNLPESEFFLWYGHGDKRGDALYLDTDEKISVIASNLYAKDLIAYLTDEGTYWAITPDFVESYISLNHGLAYINACYSGFNDSFADSFLNAGAETVFVNVGNHSTNKGYAISIMPRILYYMAGENDANGIFYTAGEAIAMANAYFSQLAEDNQGLTLDNGDYYASWEEYIEGIQEGTHVELRGENDYTICACIRGKIDFDEDLELNEIAEVADTLSVRLETEDGDMIANQSVNEDGTFYMNELDEGTYQVVLYQSGKQICQPVEVQVKEHRYTAVSLPYSALVQLEGYVYSSDGAALLDVVISAEMTADNGLWNVQAQTDENGYYCLEVFGENVYSISYEKEGYVTQNNIFNVSSEIFENAQEGVSYQMEDVILEKETSYLDEMEIIESDHYDGNEGDSFVYKIGEHNYSRGNTDINGVSYEHGIECWIARWNYKSESSWAYSVFQLDGSYNKLEGTGVLIDSYNTTDFNATLEIYGDNILLFSYRLTPSTIPFDINIDITGVSIIKIYVYDNESKEGGTSFGLTDMRLS